MKPKIEKSSFGSITIEGQKYSHDVIIRLSGEIEKRKKKLSKKHYGTSHTISREEAEFVYEEGAEGCVIGSGQYGKAELSEEAAEFFEKKGCRVRLLSTPEATEYWNENTPEKSIGLFHTTC